MNGSGCTVVGEPAQRETPSGLSEAKVRTWIRRVALPAAVVGTVWLLVSGISFFSRTFVTAKVEGIIPQSGECRRPSGRYQNCMQSRAVVLFDRRAAEGSAAPVRAEILIPEKKVSLAPGDSIMVGYREQNPHDVILPDVRAFATVPLGILFTSLMLLGLERLTRQSH
jgi:hypothetical protein